MMNHVYVFLAACACRAPSALALLRVDERKPARAAADQGADDLQLWAAADEGADGLRLEGAPFCPDAFNVRPEEGPVAFDREYCLGPEDPQTFDRDFGGAWDDARRALRVAEAPKEESSRTRHTVNVVISVREDDELPPWCQRIVDGSWGEGVSLSVYVKTKGLKPDEERVLKRGDRFQMIAIPNFGRNEHAYVWHLARSAPSFSGVEIFTKDKTKQKGYSRSKWIVLNTWWT